MRIAVATYSTRRFESVRKLTAPNKRAYCSRHGYGFRENPPTDKDATASFDRYEFYLALLASDQFDWLYCLDADAIVTNFNRRIEDIIKPDDTLIFPMDAVALQTGGFLARDCLATKFLFRMMVLSRDKHQTDQRSLSKFSSWMGPIIRRAPQREFGSYDYGYYRGLDFVSPNYVAGKDFEGNDGQWQPGDFIFHAPGMPIPKKVEALKRFLDQVQK